MKKYRKANKIYDRCLPTLHPDRASLRLNIGDVHLANEDYQKAREEYEAALQLQTATLPADNPYIVQTLHNLAMVHAHQGNMDEANKYLKRAEEIAREVLSVKHPLVASIERTKTLLLNED